VGAAGESKDDHVLFVPSPFPVPFYPMSPLISHLGVGGLFLYFLPSPSFTSCLCFLCFPARFLPFLSYDFPFQRLSYPTIFLLFSLIAHSLSQDKPKGGKETTVGDMCRSGSDILVSSIVSVPGWCRSLQRHGSGRRPLWNGGDGMSGCVLGE